MVRLLLTAVDRQGELREFTCQLPDIDSGFDVLSELAATGNILVEARLFEEDSWTPLPPEAFDGQPISPRIRELQKDWQLILNQPGK
jgi:hypothetical protein